MENQNLQKYREILSRYAYNCSPEMLLEIIQNIESLTDVINKFEARKKQKRLKIKNNNITKK